MATRKKKWTKEEEEILVQAITANPHNIVKACRNTSMKIDRSVNACLYYWYKVLAPANNPIKAGITFMTISSKTVYKNRKNSGSAIAKPKRDTLWTKIKKFIELK